MDCPNKKSNQNKGSKKKSEQKKTHDTRGEYKGKGHEDMSKIKCYNCGEYGHYACDCPKPHDNANLVQENEQNKELENMMDLDDSSVNKECAMVCMDVQHEDLDENIVVYGDQGVRTEEHDEATYEELIDTDSKNEQGVKNTLALCAKDSVLVEKKEDDLMIHPHAYDMN